MANITLDGNPITTIGRLPAKDTVAPDFKLVIQDLSEIKLAHFTGKKVILNIFPSHETAVCAMALRRFNSEASNLKNTAVVCVSMDLPFASKRFCSTEGLNNVITASDFRYGNFGIDYGVLILDGPFKGLLARAVIVLDESHKIIYTEQVTEIGQEPDYDAALKARTP